MQHLCREHMLPVQPKSTNKVDSRFRNVCRDMCLPNIEQNAILHPLRYSVAIATSSILVTISSLPVKYTDVPPSSASLAASSICAVIFLEETYRLLLGYLRHLLGDRWTIICISRGRRRRGLPEDLDSRDYSFYDNKIGSASRFLVL